ncbi:50S ribosomal protein L18 [Candidatus Methanosphaera massiliense]|uniref:50S ribosomal protein L18 n=1 Tax=Methanosphaera TaxID=2316 RepID=UPI000DC48100|nr:50S ribosomal protein L18 [Candidatus Methanosphaera massiliense]MDD6285207.1 50S ribosomal protein L18 [Methanobacteriaceae archaeon]MDE4078480.1 50S ribosomal protein L18 [Candidatus Methanosphaera massiliense]MDY2744913.1 50S ribosomal protein L18 [Methanosphaera sp.]RAP45526.1 MAG: 50S ribosomal protein L18 [Methanosphaera sp. SHI1033]
MARGATYKVQFKRRREGKTNYNKRYKLVDLDKTRMVVRITSNHTITQLVKIGENGDETLVSATSKQLKDYGWLGNGKNTSAAYLTGYLFGKKALNEDYTETILDIGLQHSIAGTKIYAVLKGALDAGLEIPHNDSVLPDESRIRGEHIAQYAESMDEDEKNTKFSNYIRCGLSPEELPDHFESVKNKIDEATQ